MKILRLVLFPDCNRKCEGCCNKDWNIGNLPVVENYKDYNMVLLTGGEPLLKPQLVLDTIKTIRKESDAKIILYTAMTHKDFSFRLILDKVDGVTVTLHTQEDVEWFEALCGSLSLVSVYGKSMRLNIFKDVITDMIPLCWEVKKDIEWIKDCPLPENEVLMRLK